MKRKLLVFLTMLMMAEFVQAQNLTQADFRTLEEIVYLELNSSLLIPGENLLVSVSVKNRKGTPSQISKVAYLEIIDSELKPAVLFKTELREGLGSAAIYLPSFLKTGSYTVICYTKWMKNYSLASIPQYPIRIINPFEKLPIGLFKASKSLEEVSVTFKPESGYFHLDQKQSVNFQAINQFGNGVPITGRITNSSGQPVVSFRSGHDGSGTFEFIPTANESYTAIVVDSTQSSHILGLPIDPIRTVSVEFNESNEVITIRHSPGTPADHILEVWMSGRKAVSARFGEYTIRKDTLPPGLTVIRVIDNDGNEYYEKTLFIKSIERTLEVGLSGKNFSTREKITLLPDLSSLGKIQHLTLSVRQKVEQPTSIWPEIRDQNKLITSSNSKIVIPRDIMFSETNYQLNYLPDLHGELVSGKIFDDLWRPVPNAVVSMTSNARCWTLVTSTSDGDGSFFMNLKPTENDDNQFFYSNTKVKSANNLVLENPFLSAHNFVNIKPLYLDPGLEEWLRQKSIYVQIENAYFTQKKPETTLQSRLKLNDLTPESKTYYLDDFTRFPTIEDVIREYVQEVWLRESGGTATFSFPFIENRSDPLDSTLVLLNGIPINPLDILTIDQANVEKIDLFEEQIKLGSWEFRGVVNFQTFSDVKPYLSNIEQYQTSNYNAPRVFFEPVVRPKQFNNQRIPDFRTQLHWDPDVSIEELSDGITFFTSDVVGTFELIFSGETTDGETIFAKTEFEVSD